MFFLTNIKRLQFEKAFSCHVSEVMGITLNIASILNKSKSLIIQIYEKRGTEKFNIENYQKIYFASNLQKDFVKLHTVT